MLAKVFSFGLLGIEAYPIEVEVDVACGLAAVGSCACVKRNLVGQDHRGVTPKHLLDAYIVGTKKILPLNLQGFPAFPWRFWRIFCGCIRNLYTGLCA